MVTAVLPTIPGIPITQEDTDIADMVTAVLPTIPGIPITQEDTDIAGMVTVLPADTVVMAGMDMAADTALQVVTIISRDVEWAKILRLILFFFLW
jgi:hypothetical protein